MSLAWWMAKIPEFDAHKENGNWKARSSRGHWQPVRIEPFKTNVETWWQSSSRVVYPRTWAWRRTPLETVRLTFDSNDVSLYRKNLSVLLQSIDPAEANCIISCIVLRDQAKFPFRWKVLMQWDGRKCKVNEVFTCSADSKRRLWKSLFVAKTRLPRFIYFHSKGNLNIKTKSWNRWRIPKKITNTELSILRFYLSIDEYVLYQNSRENQFVTSEHFLVTRLYLPKFQDESQCVILV